MVHAGRHVPFGQEYYGTRPFLWSLPQQRDQGGVKDRFWQGGGGAFNQSSGFPAAASG